jgi:hypothetical protein
MKREDISRAIGNMSTRHIQEAESYSAEAAKVRFFQRPFGKAMIAAVLALSLLVGGIGIFSPRVGGMVVTAYAYGTDEEITAAGAIMSTGTISDTGEMKGHPLMFFLAGEDISTVRFSCKNQMINFVDWTEKRDEYGNAQNFTVPYGEDENEYYFLLIDWVPTGTIRELTDNADRTIATLPDELREDIIVMEITFANGKTATKAITVSLLDDGTFFATFNDYHISEADSFVKRPDSEAIPRDVLYGQPQLTVTFYDEEQQEVPAQALWYNHHRVMIIPEFQPLFSRPSGRTEKYGRYTMPPEASWYNMADVNSISAQWSGGTPNTVRLYYTPAGTETAEQLELLQTKVPLDGDTEVLFSLEELDKTNLYGHLQIELDYGYTTVASDLYNVFFDSDLSSSSDESEPEDQVDTIFSVAKAYYENTVFTVEDTH